MEQKAMPNRRQFLALSAKVAAMTMLSACGAPKPTEESPATAAPQSEATAVPASTPAPASGEKITVSFMNWWGAERAPLMDACIASFEESHPNIHVVNDNQPWDNREERAATAIASRTPPQVIMTRREETYKFATQDLIIPIDDYVKARNVDLSIFYPSDLNNQRWGGHLWSYPLPGDGGVTSMYLYNKEMLRQAGFDPEKPPKTWQEAETVAKAITKVEDAGIKVIGLDVGATKGAVNEFPGWLYTNNGNYYSEDAKQVLFNSPEGVEALEWMVNFTNQINGGVDKVRDFFAGTENAVTDLPFYLDTQAMWPQGTWVFGHLKNGDPEMYNDKEKWGVALRPYNGNNPKATHRGVSGNYWAWGYVIPKGLPKEVQDAAYEWIEWWITGKDPKGKDGCYFLFEQSQVSAVKECTADKAWYEINPYWDVVVKALQTDVSVPITPVQSQIAAFVDGAIEEAYYGTKTPKEALDSAAEQAQPLLDKFWSGA